MKLRDIFEHPLMKRVLHSELAGHEVEDLLKEVRAADEATEERLAKLERLVVGEGFDPGLVGRVERIDQRLSIEPGKSIGDRISVVERAVSELRDLAGTSGRALVTRPPSAAPTTTHETSATDASAGSVVMQDAARQAASEPGA